MAIVKGEYQGLNAVIGYPLVHTQSPLLHTTVYQSLGIPAVFLAFPYPKLKPLIQAIKTLSIELTAVTMPFKQRILPYLDESSPEVSTLKAVNTLIQREGKLYGYNADIDGIAYALRDIVIADKNVLIVGAGGAAAAVGYFMRQNAAKLFWLPRSRKNALKMLENFGGEVLTRAQAYKKSMDIIVNASPVGMYPLIDNSPLPDYPFHAAQIVFDLVYNPLETLLLKQAKKSRARIIVGRDMFIAQGLKQIELWTGKAIVTQKLVKEIREKFVL